MLEKGNSLSGREPRTHAVMHLVTEGKARETLDVAMPTPPRTWPTTFVSSSPVLGSAWRWT